MGRKPRTLYVAAPVGSEEPFSVRLVLYWRVEVQLLEPVWTGGSAPGGPGHGVLKVGSVGPRVQILVDQFIAETLPIKAATATGTRFGRALVSYWTMPSEANTAAQRTSQPPPRSAP